MINWFEDYFDKIELYDQGIGAAPLQPVSLLLLDINMPIINGLETLKLVKDKFKRHNTRQNQRVIPLEEM